MIRYDIYKGVQKIKTKTFLAISGFGLVVGGGAMSMAIMGSAHADSNNQNFENPPYTVGDINIQDGWMKTGAFDAAVVSNTYSIPAFGSQTLRISDSVTSGSFGDQTFSKPLANEAGETDALNGSMSGGTRQPHFEAQFDFASVLPTVQAGMHVSVSPDRGDGARMSYLRFEDHSAADVYTADTADATHLAGSNYTDGIHVYFDEVQGTSSSANFVETDIATISRSSHTIKFSMDFVDGASNDVVKIYIDGSLIKTGTSWENYYRYDPESSIGNNSRTVDSLLFRVSGTANAADAGKGFLIDNLSLLSGPTPSSKVKVQIFKYVDGVQATAANANSATFPMTTTFTSPNLGNYTNEPFTLSPTPWGGIGQPYEADFVGSVAGADYTASEVTTGNTVVSTACGNNTPYALEGYTSGDNLAQAQLATKTMNPPQFTNLQSDKVMLVWNKKCPTLNAPPTTKADCRNDGWMTYNNPSFKNQGKCIEYVVAHGHKVKGDIKYTAGNLKRSAEFEMNTYNNNKGDFEYWDANHDHYKVKVSAVKVNGQDAWFAGVVTRASNSDWLGQWLFAKVHDNSPDQISGSFTTQAIAEAGVNAMSQPADGPFDVTKGNLKVN